MTLGTKIFALIMLGVFVSLIFLVIFGEVTVRKLRKNQTTKDALGIEFISGWDILNVAGALALPIWLNRKFRSSPLSALFADADVLYRYTNRFDRILAKMFYCMFLLSGSSLIIFCILDVIGFIK